MSCRDLHSQCKVPSQARRPSSVRRCTWVAPPLRTVLQIGLGVLRGEDGKHTKSTWTQKYSIGDHYPEGKWLRCDYGAMGEVSPAMRLPDELKECTVVGKKGTHAG